MRTISITTLLIFSFFYALAQGSDTRQGRNEVEEQLKKFNQFYQFLNYSYVDSINNSALIEDAIRYLPGKFEISESAGIHQVYKLEEVNPIEYLQKYYQKGAK